MAPSLDSSPQTPAVLEQPAASRVRKPLRLWPGVAAAVLLVLARFVAPAVVPDLAMYAVLGALAASLIILLWWLFFSRARWMERVGAILLMAAALFAASRVAHESIATGMMGLMLPIFTIPLLALALVAWAMLTRRCSDGLRRLSLVAVVVLVCGFMTLLRTGGVDGEGDSDLHWRWAKSPEERLLALGGGPGGALASPTAKPADATSAPRPAVLTSDRIAEWPGFRGPGRDSIVRGVRIKTDWSRFPPAPLWRLPVGPGWSSFAVAGEVFYTQEQRGEEEVVSCQKMTTGETVWRHRDPARFWESNAGAGPRATPTLSHGRVYTLGGTGILNALDASDGSVIWSRNVALETDTKVPMWGLSGSPLVIDDLVIVAISGRLAAYEISSGKPRWVGASFGGGYSSPHRLKIGGVEQVVLLSGKGARSVAPADGALLWEHAWEGGAIVQPAVIGEGDLLISTCGPSGGLATRRLAVALGAGGWKVETRWTSTGLKPYFNDLVVHHGHAFGFDNSILACVDLQNGERKWKGGTLRQRPTGAAARSGPAARAVRKRRVGACGRHCRRLQGTGEIPGDQRQNLEPPRPRP